VSSGVQMNSVFFGENKSPVPPSYTHTATWKSHQVRDREEFERLRQRVKHFAPEQFRLKAKPTREPCHIVPKNTAEWRQHQVDMMAIAQAEEERNCELLKAQIAAHHKIPRGKRKIKSMFGRGAKVFSDGRGPVLSQPTIWSAEYAVSGMPQAKWPDPAELRSNGDSRENDQAKTRCGRFLPPPRAPENEAEVSHEQPILRQFPLDQTGPIFSAGPRPDEIQNQNSEMNDDPSFEFLGRVLLGASLMKEIGECNHHIFSNSDCSVKPKTVGECPGTAIWWSRSDAINLGGAWMMRHS